MKVNTNPVRGMKDFLPDEAELRENIKRRVHIPGRGAPG